jgi:hypothetical protein
MVWWHDTVSVFLDTHAGHPEKTWDYLYTVEKTNIRTRLKTATNYGRLVNYFRFLSAVKYQSFGLYRKETTNQSMSHLLCLFSQRCPCPLLVLFRSRLFKAVQSCSKSLCKFNPNFLFVYFCTSVWTSGIQGSFKRHKTPCDRFDPDTSSEETFPTLLTSNWKICFESYKLTYRVNLARFWTIRPCWTL